MAQGLGFADAFRGMSKLLEGSQAVAAIYQGEPDKLCALRLGHAGGIVIAHRDGQGIVGSDLPAALPILRHRPGPVGFLESGGNGGSYPRGSDIFRPARARPSTSNSATYHRKMCWWTGGGYRHFMLKEIMEQPQAVAGALRGRVNFEAGRVELPDFPLTDQEIKDLQRVVLIGCGTSLNAAQVGRHFTERFAGLPAEVESASEYRYREPILDRNTLVVAISQSGGNGGHRGRRCRRRNSGGRACWRFAMPRKARRRVWPVAPSIWVPAWKLALPAPRPLPPP